MDLLSIHFCLIDCDCTADAQVFAFTQRAPATRTVSPGSDTVPANLFVLTNLFVRDTRRPANKTFIFVQQIHQRAPPRIFGAAAAAGKDDRNDTAHEFGLAEVGVVNKGAFLCAPQVLQPPGGGGREVSRSLSTSEAHSWRAAQVLEGRF